MISLLLCAICCVCFVLWRVRKDSGAPKLPPKYPGQLPFIGHAYILLGNSSRLWKKIKEITAKCIEKGGLIHFYIGPELYYAITDPDDLLKVSNSCLQKHFAYQFAKSWLGNGLGTSSGEIWKRHRRLLGPAFSLPVVYGYLDVFNSQSRKMVEDIAAHVDMGQFIHSVYMKKMALEIFCKTAFGIDGMKKGILEKYIKGVDEILSIVVQRFQQFWLHSDLVYQFSVLKRREDKAIKTLNTISDEVIQRKKAMIINGGISVEAKGMGGRHKPLLDLMLELSAKDALTDKETREEVDNTIAVGSDTTSNFLTCLAVLMGGHPEVQERMHTEIIQVVGSERDIVKEDLHKLVYTEAVIKETLRYIPTTPIILRYVDKDVQLKNYTLRAGSQCALLLTGAMRDPSWGPDVEQFRPERWLDPASLPANLSNAFAAFSLGKRYCIGKGYALTLIKVTVAHFFRAYRVTSDLSNLQMKLDFILKPKSGHEITLQRRH